MRAGQHEIDFKYGDALKMADDVMTFKIVVKRIAQNHHRHATFMPEPIYGIAGSGMHINMSLCTGRETHSAINPTNWGFPKRRMVLWRAS